MIFNYIHWDINPEIVNLFGISIRYYGILFIGGIFLAVHFLERLFKIEQIAQKKLEKLSIYGLVGIILGARLGHCLFYEPEYYLTRPLEMLLPLEFKASGGVRFVGYQGLASHGGAVGLIIAIWFYAYKTKESMIKTLDLIAIVTPIAATFIRLANLMNSEIVGMPTSKPWAFVFTKIDELPRHPAQLYEALCYLVIFGINLIVYKKYRSKLKNGFFFGLTIFLIFISRFFIEFVKEHQVAFEHNMVLDMGQWLSIPFVFAGVGFMYYGLRKGRLN